MQETKRGTRKLSWTGSAAQQNALRREGKKDSYRAQGKGKERGGWGQLFILLEEHNSN